MEITVRPAALGDLPSILEMMRDFADFVGLREYLTVTEAAINEAVFGRDAFVRLLVASAGGALVGYAIYYPHFSSFRGERGFFLEDIFVDHAHRGSGTGLRLLREIAREADGLGFTRIDFQVLKDNAGAISFYKRHGAEANEDELHFKFAGEAFSELARSQVAGQFEL